MKLTPAIVDVVSVLGHLSFLAACAIVLLPALRAVWSRYSILFIFVTAAAGIFLSRRAVDLGIPDAAEYFAVANRLLYDQRFDLAVRGADIPSRYQPWFSWIFLVPFMRIVAWDTAIRCFVVEAWMLLFLAATALTSVITPRQRIFPWSVGVAVFSLPAILYFATLLMTDVLVCACTLVAAVAFCAPAPDRTNLIRSVATGWIIATGVACRPLSVLLTLPFLLNVRKSPLSTVAVMLPVIASIASSLWVNAVQFGTLFRTGYNLWVGVPYDYFGLVVNFRYFIQNVWVMVGDPAFLLVTVVALIPFGAEIIGTPLTTDTLKRFFLLAILPLIAFHLFYFYPSIRFFLPMMVICYIGGVGRLIVVTPKDFLGGALIAAMLLMELKEIAVEQRNHSGSLPKLIASMQDCISPDAIVISNMHPMIIQELLVRGTSREVLPLSRSTELASKVLTPTKVDLPTDVTPGPFEHRLPSLRNGGATEAYPKVAVDDFDYIKVALEMHRSVVLLLPRAQAMDVTNLSQQFKTTPLCPGVEQLSLLKS